jgi:hypothetical protein
LLLAQAPVLQTDVPAVNVVAPYNMGHVGESRAAAVTTGEGGA